MEIVFTSIPLVKVIMKYKWASASIAAVLSWDVFLFVMILRG